MKIQNSIDQMQQNYQENKTVILLHGIVASISAIALAVLVVNPITPGIVFGIVGLSLITASCSKSLIQAFMQNREPPLPWIRTCIPNLVMKVKSCIHNIEIRVKANPYLFGAIGTIALACLWRGQVEIIRHWMPVVWHSPLTEKVLQLWKEMFELLPTNLPRIGLGISAGLFIWFKGKKYIGF